VRWIAIAALGLAGCVSPLAPCLDAAPGDRRSCPVSGHTDRAFDVTVPDDWDGATPLPVIIAFHGGGGRRESAVRVTCPDGDLDDPGCLPAAGAARRYVVVLPDGTGTRPFRNIRTWNGGGGVGDWQCVSGAACRSDVDDIGYVDDLLDELERFVPVAEVYATGLSNGGAMSHRLACERADRVAAIAGVGGQNQFAAAGGDCDVQVPVLQIHGTEDPCWEFETGAGACAQDDGKDKVGAVPSAEGWAARNGCTGAVEEPLPDADPGDGTTITRVRWTGCTADVEMLRVDGGGHTWPGGWSYSGEDRIGRVSHDLDGTAAILDFFDAHR
jgi:polyhydroxybutyrate depolymerase